MTDVALEIDPPALETWDHVPPATVAALDLLALTIPGADWAVDVRIGPITLTARPEQPSDATGGAA